MAGGAPPAEMLGSGVAAMLAPNGPQAWRVCGGGCAVVHVVPVCCAFGGAGSVVVGASGWGAGGCSAAVLSTAVWWVEGVDDRLWQTSDVGDGGDGGASEGREGGTALVVCE